jgi:hypothetical protein
MLPEGEFPSLPTEPKKRYANTVCTIHEPGSPARYYNPNKPPVNDTVPIQPPQPLLPPETVANLYGEKASNDEDEN